VRLAGTRSRAGTASFPGGYNGSSVSVSVNAGNNHGHAAGAGGRSVLSPIAGSPASVGTTLNTTGGSSPATGSGLGSGGLTLRHGRISLGGSVYGGSVNGGSVNGNSTGDAGIAAGAPAYVTAPHHDASTALSHASSGDNSHFAANTNSDRDSGNSPLSVTRTINHTGSSHSNANSLRYNGHNGVATHSAITPAAVAASVAAADAAATEEAWANNRRKIATWLARAHNAPTLASPSPDQRYNLIDFDALLADIHADAYDNTTGSSAAAASPNASEWRARFAHGSEFSIDEKSPALRLTGLTALEAVERVVDLVPSDDVKLETLRAQAQEKFPELYERKPILLDAGVVLRVIRIQRWWRAVALPRVLAKRIAEERERLVEVERSVRLAAAAAAAAKGVGAAATADNDNHTDMNTTSATTGSSSLNPPPAPPLYSGTAGGLAYNSVGGSSVYHGRPAFDTIVGSSSASNNVMPQFSALGEAGGANGNETDLW